MLMQRMDFVFCQRSIFGLKEAAVKLWKTPAERRRSSLSAGAWGGGVLPTVL